MRPVERRFALATLLVLLVVLVGGRARADHGAWHHNPHIADPTPSTYSAYAHTYSTDQSDYLYARIIVYRNGVLVGDRARSCGYVDEGCQNERTTTVYWSQGGDHTVSSVHCGQDGNHHINTSGVWCEWTYGSTAAHSHEQEWSD